MKLVPAGENIVLAASNPLDTWIAHLLAVLRICSIGSGKRTLGGSERWVPAMVVSPPLDDTDLEPELPSFPVFALRLCDVPGGGVVVSSRVSCPWRMAALATKSARTVAGEGRNGGLPPACKPRRTGLAQCGRICRALAQ